MDFHSMAASRESGAIRQRFNEGSEGQGLVVDIPQQLADLRRGFFRVWLESLIMRE